MLFRKKACLMGLQLSINSLLIFLIFYLSNGVRGKPSAKTVAKARCYANCVTQVSHHFKLYTVKPLWCTPYGGMHVSIDVVTS